MNNNVLKESNKFVTKPNVDIIDNLLFDDLEANILKGPAEEKEIKSFYFNGKMLFKYMVIGGGILALKYSILYFIQNPEQLQHILQQRELFEKLPTQYQILILFVVITIVFFTIERVYLATSNNSRANSVFGLLREYLMSKDNFYILESDIIDYYAKELKVNNDYFQNEILPEVKRLAILDKNIQITKDYQCNVDTGEKFEVELWHYSEKLYLTENVPMSENRM